MSAEMLMVALASAEILVMAEMLIVALHRLALVSAEKLVMALMSPRCLGWG